ncbi:MAG: DUF6713 family protein [Cyanobacteria bacterium P01_F01_bin.53]
MRNLTFHLGLSMLIAHELDAVLQAEWRLLFILRRMPEDTAATAFILLHVPLVAGLLWITNHASEYLRNNSRLAMATFFIIHAGLHKRLEHHVNYSFTSTPSVFLIYGTGVLSIGYLLASFLASRRTTPGNTSSGSAAS